jgi:hypothetical protein
MSLFQNQEIFSVNQDFCYDYRPMKKKDGAATGAPQATGESAAAASNGASAKAVSFDPILNALQISR